MADSPFLGSGSSSVDDWDREINPRVEDFDAIKDVDDLLERLATQRRVTRSPTSGQLLEVADDGLVSDRQSPRAAAESQTPIGTTAAVVSALAAAAAVLIPLLSSPSPARFAGVGLCAGLAIGFLFLRDKAFAATALAVILTIGGGVLGGRLEPQAAPSSHGYFVSIGLSKVLEPVIEPHAYAPRANGPPLVVGDKVNVRCVGLRGEHRWAELEDGAWIEARFLRPELGGDPAPSC